MEVKIKLKNPRCYPRYATKLSSGADLVANIEYDMVLDPQGILLVPTGIFLEIPQGLEAQIRPRSGLALKNGITVLNTPGTIDADYRGEIKVVLINHSKKKFIIAPKMKIAQIVFAKVEKVELVNEENLTKTIRGEGGFGHSGLY